VLFKSWGAIRVGVAIVLAVIVAASIMSLVAEPATSKHHRAREARRAATSPRPAPRLTHFTIGHSVRGRTIEAFELARSGASKPVLVVGCVDGNEPAGIAIARRLLTAPLPAGSALWIVPDLNPDGVAKNTRVNADLVDLNRNFPWHWRPLGPRGDPQYAGPRPLSEPEARAARVLIRRVRPRITVWFHQPAGLVDLSGGDPRIERRFARLVGLPVKRLTRYPGSAVSWGNSALPGTTAFVVELPPGPLSRGAINRYVRAVLALAGPTG
jgi:protein MpaA